MLSPNQTKEEVSTLLELHHADYSLYVSASAYGRMREKAENLLKDEKALLATYGWPAGAQLFLGIGDGTEAVDSVAVDGDQLLSGDEAAVFFEQTDYQFVVDFSEAVTAARVVRIGKNDEALKSDEEQTVAHFFQRRHHLSFNLNFKNQIGQTDIVVGYTLGGVERQLTLHIDVLSVKLNYHADLKLLLHTIEQEYAMLSLDFLKKTYHTFGVADHTAATPDLIWWNIFQRVQREFCEAVSHVVERPHHRLRMTHSYRRADQLRRLSPQLENEWAEHQSEDRHLYRAEEWTLNDAAPENRFVKFALSDIARRYDRLYKQIHERAPEASRKEMDSEREELQRLQGAPLLRRVGRFTGLKGENLTLKQATGYSTIYKDWLLLQGTYDLHDGIQHMELKDIAELYEIWCFIEVKNKVRALLAEQKGAAIEQLVPEGSTGYKPLQPMFVASLQHGERSRVVLRHNDVELAHVVYNAELSDNETTNAKSGLGSNIGSLTVGQRPDIVLRLTKADVAQGVELTYLFDAKYRIDVTGKDDTRMPPDDAINQMHRYRDAIIYSDGAYGDGAMGELKREVVGGYILFPDKEPDKGTLPQYYKSISKVNIGAIPLHPETAHQKDTLLSCLLADIIRGTRSELLLKSIPQRGLLYKETSPMVLVGYAQKEEFEVVKEMNFYYIRAVKNDESMALDEGSATAKYVLIHRR